MHTKMVSFQGDWLPLDFCCFYKVTLKFTDSIMARENAGLRVLHIYREGAEVWCAELRGPICDQRALCSWVMRTQ